MPNQVNYCGTPGNASWVSFDWYAADTQPKNCGNGTADCHVDTHVSTFVTPTLAKLKTQKYHYQDILLYPGAYSGGNQSISAIGANEILSRYVDIAKADNSVIGVVPFTYITPPGVTWKGVSTMPNGEQAEMFYEGIAIDSINGLSNASWKPVFEYNDDKQFTKTGAMSPADSHFYTLGYQGAETGFYTIRRLAFYMKASSGGIYTSKIYRCRVARPNGRHTVYFTPNSNCDGALGAVQDGIGYVSPTSTGEADHLIVNCRKSVGPYWDQGWVLVGSGQNGSATCVSTFGSDYVYFTHIGYSKKM